VSGGDQLLTAVSAIGARVPSVPAVDGHVDQEGARIVAAAMDDPDDDPLGLEADYRVVGLAL